MSYDIHFESTPEGENHAFGFVTFGDYERHQGVQGPQKMVNRYLKCLITPVGSDYTDLYYGTSLMTGWGGNIDPTNLRELVVDAVRDAEDQIRAYDLERFAPTNERLATVTIDDILIDPTGTGFTLYITLTNVAETKVTIAVPFTE